MKAMGWSLIASAVKKPRKGLVQCRSEKPPSTSNILPMPWLSEKLNERSKEIKQEEESRQQPINAEKTSTKSRCMDHESGR